ncbi:branched-chain amino acid transport system ATP-binding protein [Roseiarcus fermentans]|uniref:Branched-chain amino acid transport system ATP-binding protein n=1 Tax=Roseiarcus fermentans TaxID=1473586 RepID=A0A366EIL4_9HYPH|nr:ABC transporter ATP-binding protein [Roseiarcus fermentans]RBP02203.1 branched-chain amino acid transport system ATP-binding protein [Roseiarcus fermentans]
MSLCSVRRLSVGYGDFKVLFDIDLDIDEGQAMAMIGANGAGKTTLLRAITGLLKAPDDSIKFAGRPIAGTPPHAIVALGVAMVPEGRCLFPSLSVEENLLVGAHAKRRGPWTLQRVYDLFPALLQRRRAPVELLSGGQQQMVAIGRALMSNPRLLLCDEVSLGLAPIVIKSIYCAFPAILAEGTTILVVEQDIGRAIAMADTVTCLQEGKVTLAGPPKQFSRADITAAYFGR